MSEARSGGGSAPTVLRMILGKRLQEEDAAGTLSDQPRWWHAYRKVVPGACAASPCWTSLPRPPCGW